MMHNQEDEIDDEEPPELIPARSIYNQTPTELFQSKIVPVTIITGFLGSGKSTLLRYILSADHGLRIAVIENEFGDSMDIENLIATDGVSGERMAGVFELRNGCVCCSVKDDLVQTLDYLIEQRESNGLAFDHILIETTGLANPGPVAASLWVDEQQESHICLDGIVTLVDSKNITRHLQMTTSPDGEETVESVHSTEALKQIAFADRILLNKTDLVNKQQVLTLRKMISKINTLCAIVETSHSIVDLEWVLKINSLAKLESSLFQENMCTEQQQEPGSCSECSCCESTPDKCCVSKFGNTRSTEHDPSVTTELFLYHGLVHSVPVFEQWLGGLLWNSTKDEEMEIYRMKGIFSVKNERHQYILQVVNDIFDIQPTTQLSDDKNQSCQQSEHIIKIVIIGRSLNRAKIDQSLNLCIG